MSRNPRYYRTQRLKARDIACGSSGQGLFRQIAFQSAEAITKFLKWANENGIAAKRAGEGLVNVAGVADEHTAALFRALKEFGGMFRNRA